MSPTPILTSGIHELLALLPALILAAWGLLVLTIDFSLLRKASSNRRQSSLGAITLFGVLVALGCSIVPILHRTAPDTFPGLFTVNSTEPDLSVFFGTIASDSLTEWVNFILLGLLALTVGLSLSYHFTEEWGEYFALILWATVGMMLLAAADELLTLFLTLETMTICLYLATALEKDRKRSAEGGLKYFVYGSVSSAMFLFGLSWIYGLTGSTRLDSIHAALAVPGTVLTGMEGNIAAAAAVLLVLVGFGFKIAAVPFHQWAPDAYEGAPAPVSAWIATGSKIASFIALIKVLVYALGTWSSQPGTIAGPGWIGIVAGISAITMTYGNFAALAQTNLKRMLAYSSIAHAGYMLVGVLAASVSTRSEQAAGTVLFYLVVYSFTNIGAFAVAAWIVRDRGTDDISDLNGLGRRYPGLAVCIVLLMLSLIGMPPLGGFFAKIAMFSEAMDNEASRGRIALTWLVALGLFNSVVSAFYYVRVLKAMFLRDATVGSKPLGEAGPAISLPIMIGTLVALGTGLYPAPLQSVMQGAAVHMLTIGNFETKMTTSGSSGDMDPIPISAPAISQP